MLYSNYSKRIGVFMAMKDDAFNLIIEGIEKNVLTNEKIEQLKSESLSEEQTLLFVYALLTHAKKYLLNSLLVSEKLDFNQINFDDETKSNISRFFNQLSLTNFSQYTNIFERFLDLFSKEKKDVSACLDKLISTFNEITENSRFAARLIAYSIEDESKKGSNIRVYNIIENLEKIDLEPLLNIEKEKFITILKEFRVYSINPTHEKLNKIKNFLETEKYSETRLYDQNKSVFEEALSWAKNQEFRLLKKSLINISYLGVYQKNQKLLASDYLNENQKKFLTALQANLDKYRNHPDIKTLKLIKNKVNKELDQFKLNEIYKNNLYGVLNWLKSEKKEGEKLTRLSLVYKELQKNGTLILPLKQALDPRIGSGSCSGYVSAWAVGLLEGEGKRQVLGVKPSDEPLFKMVDYSQMKVKMPELNHVFFSTEHINRLQLEQHRIRSQGHLNSSEKIIHQLEKSETQRSESNSTDEKKISEGIKEMANALVNQAEWDRNPNRVYGITISGEVGAHALGLWRTNKGVYHFLDANFGWFRFDNGDQFKAWFEPYFSLSNYSKLFQNYQISSYSLKPATFLEFMRNTFIYKTIQFIQDKVSAWFSDPVAEQILIAEETREAASMLSKSFNQYVLSPNAQKEMRFFEEELSLRVRGLAIEEPKKPVEDNLEHLASRRRGNHENKPRYDLRSLVDTPVKKAADRKSFSIFHPVSSKEVVDLEETPKSSPNAPHISNPGK